MVSKNFIHISLWLLTKHGTLNYVGEEVVVERLTWCVTTLEKNWISNFQENNSAAIQILNVNCVNCCIKLATKLEVVISKILLQAAPWTPTRKVLIEGGYVHHVLLILTPLVNMAIMSPSVSVMMASEVHQEDHVLVSWPLYQYLCIHTHFKNNIISHMLKIHNFLQCSIIVAFSESLILHVKYTL